jgi:hypothetical protein
VRFIPETVLPVFANFFHSQFCNRYICNFIA